MKGAEFVEGEGPKIETVKLKKLEEMEDKRIKEAYMVNNFKIL